MTTSLSRILPLILMFLLLLTSNVVLAAEEQEPWTPTPPRLSYLEGQVSYWRSGAEDWAEARVNLPLADGDALYAGTASNFEVQFGDHSFVRADEDSELMLVALQEGQTHFNVTGGLVSFDMRRLAAGKRVEVSTPNAVFLIEDPGYYRVEVGGTETHFITRRGGQATVTTGDGLSLSILPSEEIVVTAGTPVQVATYVAPEPDAWDKWNDSRSERIGESISARYLSPDIYGVEDLDNYGQWRVVDTYGAVWIPDGVSSTWTPYSTGYWEWDPYYEWTWVDYEPWGWAPFHYGRWVYIDGYWAWAPGPVVPRAVYAPALVAFITPTSHVSVGVSVGLTDMWWVPLWWGEPIVPWWHHHRHRGGLRWEGWGGPRIVNGREIRGRGLPKVANIHYHNATLPQGILSMPADKFGRERPPVMREGRYHATDFAPIQGTLPVKPSPASLSGGAPRGIQPPRRVVSRRVISIEKPRPPAPEPWQAKTPSHTTQEKLPEVIYMVPPAHRNVERRPLQRPPFGSETGPERVPPPQPPAYDEIKRAVPQRELPQRLPATPGQPAQRGQLEERVVRPPFSPPIERGQEQRPQSEQPPVEIRREVRPQPTPQPPVEIRREVRPQPTPQSPVEIRREIRPQPAPQPPVEIRREMRPQRPVEIRRETPAQRPVERPREQRQPFSQPGQPAQPRGEVQRPLPGHPANQPRQRRDRE